MNVSPIITAYGAVMAIQLGNLGLQAFLRHRRSHRPRTDDPTTRSRRRSEEER